MVHVCMEVGLEANTRSIMEDPPEWKCVGKSMVSFTYIRLTVIDTTLFLRPMDHILTA